MDELSQDEQKQFEQMQKQEAEEQAIITQEKTAPQESEALAEPEKPVEIKTEEPKTVPLTALHEERTRRKAAEDAARQAELNQARMDERLKAINERLNPPAQSKEIPDPEKDALGALKATTEEIKAFREFMAQQKHAQIQQAQANNQIQEITNYASAQEDEFKKTAPDYDKASEFLRNSRYKELVLAGQSPFEARTTMQNEAFALAANAKNQGRNPAQMIYEFAKLRGYSKATANPTVQESDAAKLARIAEGQKANMSLGNLNDTPPKPQMSSKDILAMDDEAFEKFLEKLPLKDQAKYFGA